MKINSVEVKNFWDAQARKAGKLKLEGVANLEEDAELLEMKIRTEQEKIMGMIDLDPATSSVLDLGAGAGQWAFRFAAMAQHVTAVEYSAEMLAHAIEAGRDQGFENVTYEHCSAQDYHSETKFDLIWISGLLIYLEDEECEALVRNCISMLAPDGRLVLRDGTGTKGRHEIRDQYSPTLDANYSATYRTAETYLALFEKHGFRTLGHDDMFPEGSILNKWDETRLRVYEFARK